MGKRNKQKTQELNLCHHVEGENSKKAIYVAIISLVLSLITISVTIWQGCLQKAQVNIVNRDSMLKRPYLGVESPMGSVDASGIVDVRFLVTNFGDIPAEDVRLDFEMLLGQESLKKESNASIIIMPKQQFFMGKYHLEGSKVHDIWNLKIALYAIATLKYKGPASDNKYQHYCKWQLEVTGPKSYQWLLIESRNSNESDSL